MPLSLHSQVPPENMNNVKTAAADMTTGIQPGASIRMDLRRFVCLLPQHGRLRPNVSDVCETPSFEVALGADGSSTSFKNNGGPPVLLAPIYRLREIYFRRGGRTSGGIPPVIRW